jgi:acetyl-CoA carboxylase carboxyltransferase component
MMANNHPHAERLARLQAEREQAERDAQERQHRRGKRTARERVLALLDGDTFSELDPFAIHRSTHFDMDRTHALGDGVITGFGHLDGRPVCIFSQDFTVFGGSLGEVFAEKVVKIMDMAKDSGVPMIGINDSAGARIQEGVEGLEGYGHVFYRNVLCSGIIPQVSIIAGPCAGGAVYSPAMTDLVVMVDGISQMFITGPDVIKAVTNEDVTHEALGGAHTHAARSGVAHLVAVDEDHAVDLVRAFLSYLPSNNKEQPPHVPTTDDPQRADQELDELVPELRTKPYDMRAIIRRVVDTDSFFELQPEFAQNILTGFARLDGYSVGIVANQPLHLAGTLDISASEKAARFVRLCDAFNVPLVTFEDVPGFLPGTTQEYGGIIRHGSKLLYAYCEATVPKLTVITRKAYGGAYVVMCSKSVGADLNLAWPTAEVAVMGPDAAVAVIARREIAAAPDPAVKREELVADYEERFANPFAVAARGYVDDVIQPRETRSRLIQALALLRNKQRPWPERRHGNIPL